MGKTSVCSAVCSNTERGKYLIKQENGVLITVLSPSNLALACVELPAPRSMWLCTLLHDVTDGGTNSSSDTTQSLSPLEVS